MNSLGNKQIMAKNIQYYMDLNGKTRNDMCEALGVKYTTFTDWVKGNSYPRIDKIELMANYFGIEKSDLVEEKQFLPDGAIPYTNRKMVLVPLVGVVNCGVPLFAEDNIEEYIDTPSEDLETGQTYFWLRAKGNSMVNVGIHEGDLLLIRKQDDVDSGDIAVVSINGDNATLKRVIKKENAIILQPENPACETKFFVGEEINTIKIRGRLMKLEKRF